MVIGLAGEALAGAGLMTGSTTLFSAGMSAYSLSTSTAAIVWGSGNLASQFSRLSAFNNVEDDLPTLEIDSGKMPNIAKNIENAQSKGAPNILTRTEDPATIASNRNAACAKFCGQGSPDEYPFESTYEGGKGAFVRGVPLQEQRIQGGVVSSFYQRNNIVDGSQFRVSVK